MPLMSIILIAMSLGLWLGFILDVLFNRRRFEWYEERVVKLFSPINERITYKRRVFFIGWTGLCVVGVMTLPFQLWVLCGAVSISLIGFILGRKNNSDDDVHTYILYRLFALCGIIASPLSVIGNAIAGKVAVPSLVLVGLAVVFYSTIETERRCA